MEGKIEAVKSGGIVLKVVEHMSGMYGWTSLDYWKERFNQSLKLT